jgi:hypothetical protein
MNRIAVVLLADTDTAGDMGRMANALTTVQEAREAGDDVHLIFDGAGTKWVGVLAALDHKHHETFASVREAITGVCTYCAKAYGVADQVEAAGLPLTSEYEGHPSLRSLASDGFQVITF